MTQLQATPAVDCDTLLRQARELLARGELAAASAAGWDAAALAMAGYAGAGVDFTKAAQQLVKDDRGHTDAAEWVASAMALFDNAGYDWLDGDGVSRRLDDAQRLVILIKDIAEPPQGAKDLLRRAWECMDNGALAPASEKGWEAALRATKTCADAMGYDYLGDNHFDLVMRALSKDGAWRKEAAECESSALALRSNAAYCTVYPHWLHDKIVSDDIDAVATLVSLMQQLSFASDGSGGEIV